MKLVLVYNFKWKGKLRKEIQIREKANKNMIIKIFHPVSVSFWSTFKTEELELFYLSLSNYKQGLSAKAIASQFVFFVPVEL